VSTERWHGEVTRAVNKACRLSPDGWTDAYEIAKWSHTPGMVAKYGGALIAPTLTVMRQKRKPLVEARDGQYGKEYRLTPAGKRAAKDAALSAV
jgi:hypothetical protein